LLFAAVAHFVAWIGAVLNTAHLSDKTWCVVLLVVGLLGLVFIATVAYVIAGPDGLKAKDEARVPCRRLALFRSRYHRRPSRGRAKAPDNEPFYQSAGMALAMPGPSRE
jgi:hypothetical protein